MNHIARLTAERDEARETLGHADAVAYASSCDDGPWWIVDLHAPKPVDVDEAA